MSISIRSQDRLCESNIDSDEIERNAGAWMLLQLIKIPVYDIETALWGKDESSHADLRDIAV